MVLTVYEYFEEKLGYRDRSEEEIKIQRAYWYRKSDALKDMKVGGTEVVQMFKRMKAAGVCVSVNDHDGELRERERLYKLSDAFSKDCYGA